MSKIKPPNNPIPPPQPPDEVPEPPENPDPIVVELVQIDVQVLSECAVGQTVTVRWQQDPIEVTILSGIRLGEVSETDAPLVRQRRTRTGIIVVCDTEGIRCAIQI